MSAVEVEIAEEIPETEDRPGAEEPRGRRRRRDAVEVEIEREVTKRQLIQSVSSIVVVILYMIFTLLRDRETGVVVVDPDDASDDWDEG
ncbi:MAG: hypothetical protein H6738_09810 [Alphaproteobacteria bacterium]|nr:hypothetical protein [Alphaproteobacteria bacterium]MCB9697061.1 hypothetical protein [Alphaproteobacteria bacterium]